MSMWCTKLDPDALNIQPLCHHEALGLTQKLSSMHYTTSQCTDCLVILASLTLSSVGMRRWGGGGGGGLHASASAGPS